MKELDPAAREKNGEFTRKVPFAEVSVTEALLSWNMLELAYSPANFLGKHTRLRNDCNEYHSAAFI